MVFFNDEPAGEDNKVTQEISEPGHLLGPKGIGLSDRSPKTAWATTFGKGGVGFGHRRVRGLGLSKRREINVQLDSVPRDGTKMR